MSVFVDGPWEALPSSLRSVWCVGDREQEEGREKREGRKGELWLVNKMNKNFKKLSTSLLYFRYLLCHFNLLGNLILPYSHVSTFVGFYKVHRLSFIGSLPASAS